MTQVNYSEGWVFHANKKGHSYHMAPCNDLIGHNIDSDMGDAFICSCDPKLDPDKNIIYHHAMDARPETYRE